MSNKVQTSVESQELEKQKEQLTWNALWKWNGEIFFSNTTCVCDGNNRAVDSCLSRFVYFALSLDSLSASYIESPPSSAQSLTELLTDMSRFFDKSHWFHMLLSAFHCIGRELSKIHYLSYFTPNSNPYIQQRFSRAYSKWSNWILRAIS